MFEKGYIPSEAHKQHLREARIRRKVALGFINSPETRKKMSLAATGRKGYWLGKKRPETSTHLREFAKTRIGELSPRWKGGKPRCLDCGQRTSGYKSKRCIACLAKIRVGENHPMYGRANVATLGEKNVNYKDGLSKLKKANGFYSNRRRVRKLGNGGSHTINEWLSLKIKYGFMCLCCKKTEPEISLEKDHIVPLIKGGSDSIENIQPLCKSCNARKHVKIIDFVKNFTFTLKEQ